MMQLIKNLISSNVQFVSAEMSIQEAARKMLEGDFGVLPVAESDRLIGAISDRDIAVRAIAKGLGAMTKVRDVMSDGIAWAYDDDSVEQAANIMSTRKVRRLPVVDRDKRLVSIISLGDLALEGPEPHPTAAALTAISTP
jgi:CBS domain-containing protein